MSKLKLLLLSSVTLGLTVGCASSKEPTKEPASEKVVLEKTAKKPVVDDSNILVNGEEPKGKVASTSKTIFDQTDSQGITRAVTIVTRKAGTRSPVHVMDYAVTSCVNKGQATMYLEGEAPETTKAGNCYVMPANVKGYIYNSGKSELQLTDYKIFPAGEDVSHKIEH